MRDVVGSSFMFKLIIVFLVFYISFATIAVHYAKVFRLKNTVVNIVEQYKYKPGSANGWNVIDKVDTFLANSNYNVGKVKGVIAKCSELGGQKTENGACIVPDDKHYRVVLFLVINLPVFKIDFVVPVSGDAVDYNNS